MMKRRRKWRWRLAQKYLNLTYLRLMDFLWLLFWISPLLARYEPSDNYRYRIEIDEWGEVTASYRWTGQDFKTDWWAYFLIYWALIRINYTYLLKEFYNKMCITRTKGLWYILKLELRLGTNQEASPSIKQHCEVSSLFTTLCSARLR